METAPLLSRGAGRLFEDTAFVRRKRELF